MQTGFRAAQAFVEVTARLDDDKVIAAARRAASGMDSTLRDGGTRAGKGLTAVLELAGDDAGIALVRKMDGRLRDGSARFRSSGVKVGKEVFDGAESGVDRPGWSIFLGLVKKAPKAGAEVASGLVGALKQGYSGPVGGYLIAATGAAAVVAGPLAGGILAGGLLAGLGAAGIGAGVALMIKDPEIKNAAAVAGESIGERLKSAAEPFRAEILLAIHSGELATQRWDGSIRKVLSVSSTMLNPLVNGVIRLVDNLLPAIARNINAAKMPIQAIANGLAGTGKALGEVFDMLGDNGPEAAAALSAAFFLVNSSIKMIGGTINILTEGFGLLIEAAFKLGDFIGGAGLALQGLPGPIGEAGDKMVGLGLTIHGAEERYRAMGKQSKDATDAAGNGTKALDDRTKLLNLSMSAAVREAGSLSAAFKLVNGGALSAREAESAYQAAIDGVTSSVKANGKTLDLNTEKGRANDAALRALITTTDQKAQATYDATVATKGTAAAEQDATKTYEAGRQQLIKSAMQMGRSKKEAIAYADKLMSIPKSWSTDVKINDMATAKAKDIKHEIQTINGRTVVVAVKYETHGRAPGEHIIGQGTSRADRWGGVHEDKFTRAATGLVRDAQMFDSRSPGHYLIAEPETGGELFAPKRGDMRRIKAMVSYAIENWWGGWGNFMPEGAPNSGPTPTGGGTVSPHSRGDTYVTFGPNSVVLDASKIKSLEDLLTMMARLVPSARAYRIGAAR